MLIGVCSLCWNFPFSLVCTWRLIYVLERTKERDKLNSSSFILFHFNNLHVPTTHIRHAGITSLRIVFSVCLFFVLNILRFHSSNNLITRRTKKCVMNECGVIGNCFTGIPSLYLNNAIKSFNLTYFLFYCVFHVLVSFTFYLLRSLLLDLSPFAYAFHSVCTETEFKSDFRFNRRTNIRISGPSWMAFLSLCNKFGDFILLLYLIESGLTLIDF